jgi:hypothetical protein
MHLLIDSAEGWERVTEFPHIQVMAKCGIYMALPPRLCLLEVRMQSGRLRDLIGRAVAADFYRLRSPEGWSRRPDLYQHKIVIRRLCAKSPQIDFRLTQLLERAPKYVVHAELSSVSRLERARAMGE